MVKATGGILSSANILVTDDEDPRKPLTLSTEKTGATYSRIGNRVLVNLNVELFSWGSATTNSSLVLTFTDTPLADMVKNATITDFHCDTINIRASGAQLLAYFHMFGRKTAGDNADFEFYSQAYTEVDSDPAVNVTGQQRIKVENVVEPDTAQINATFSFTTPYFKDLY